MSTRSTPSPWDCDCLMKRCFILSDLIRNAHVHIHIYKQPWLPHHCIMDTFPWQHAHCPFSLNGCLAFQLWVYCHPSKAPLDRPSISYSLLSNATWSHIYHPVTRLYITHLYFRTVHLASDHPHCQFPRSCGHTGKKLNSGSRMKCPAFPHLKVFFGPFCVGFSTPICWRSKC